MQPNARMTIPTGDCPTGLVASKRAWYTHRWMARCNALINSLLTHLGEVCRADALGVWGPHEDGPRLLGDWCIEQRLYDLLQARWMSVERDVRSGRRALLAARTTALPLLRHGVFLGALLYVGDVPERGAERALLDETIARLAEVLGAPQVDLHEADWLVPELPLDLEGAREEFERHYYADLLERSGWDLSRTAALLRLTRQALYDRLELLGLTRFRAPTDDCSEP
jgi:Bacterial regulatory protein, Fis family